MRNFVVEHVAEALPATDAAPDWTAASVLILHEPGETALAEALRTCLQGQHARVQRAAFAEAPAQAADPAFTHRIALLPGATQEGAADEAGLRDAIVRLRAVAAPPAGAPGTPPATVAYVQFAGAPSVPPPQAGTVQGCAAAFAASLHLERPDLKVRVLTLVVPGDPDGQADQVLAELATAPDYSTVSYDSQGTRRVPRPRVQEPAAYPPRPIPWSAADVVLVTGGAKGITAACALGFAAATRVRLALVGSSPHPDADPAGAGDAEITQTLARCHAAGLTAHYYACDITDAAAVAHLLDRVRQELGPITGVIHGAGVNRPRRLEQTTAADALAEVAPKVLGALNLCRALAATPPRLIAGFGSIISITGMAGNAWYGFSNEALAGILQWFGAAHPGTNVLTIAFSIWGEIGMGARMGSTRHLARLGIAAIPTVEGVRRFLHLVTHDPGAPQVVVAARHQRVPGGLDTWRPSPAPLPPAARYLEQIVHLEPGVEAVARAHLSLAADRYVADHVYKGTYLFPTVFGLEAMAQAVALVTGEHDFAALCIEDIRLERPIAVDPDDGTDIEIRVEVQEQDAPGLARRVRAAIRTAGTGFVRDHFAAVFVLNAADPAPLIALDPAGNPVGYPAPHGPLFLATLPGRTLPAPPADR